MCVCVCVCVCGGISLSVHAYYRHQTYLVNFRANASGQVSIDGCNNDDDRDDDSTDDDDFDDDDDDDDDDISEDDNNDSMPCITIISVAENQVKCAQDMSQWCIRNPVLVPLAAPSYGWRPYPGQYSIKLRRDLRVFFPSLTSS